MERIRNIYLPSTAITFTAVILCVSVLNLLEGCEYQNNIWILEAHLVGSHHSALEQ